MDSFTQTQPLIVTPPPSGFGGWFKQNVAGHLLTLIVGSAMGFLGSWYTLQDKVVSLSDKVEKTESQILQLESTAARKDDVRQLLGSIDQRLGNIENSLMRQQQR